MLGVMIILLAVRKNDPRIVSQLGAVSRHYFFWFRIISK